MSTVGSAQPDLLVETEKPLDVRQVRLRLHRTLPGERSASRRR